MPNAAVKTHGAYTLKMVYDDYPDNPRENDNFSTMVCWHSRYMLGDKHDYESRDDFFRDLVEKVCKCSEIVDFVRLEQSEQINLVSQHCLIQPLYLYDHSGLTINTTGFTCPWDSGQIGWAYVSHADIIKEYGALTPETIEKARHLLNAEVKEYDYYLRGECYGFQLLENGEEIDSCYGFLGDFDDAKEAIKGYLPDSITQLAEHINYGDDDPECEEEEEMEDEW
ncbi:hypothetical protein FACS18949_17820 [Clostridia bacterium]|nr:hypothetical protein FACS18949_17820 [Clostridia bacterium]